MLGEGRASTPSSFLEGKARMARGGPHAFACHGGYFGIAVQRHRQFQDPAPQTRDATPPRVNALVCRPAAAHFGRPP